MSAFAASVAGAIEAPATPTSGQALLASRCQPRGCTLQQRVADRSEMRRLVQRCLDLAAPTAVPVAGCIGATGPSLHVAVARQWWPFGDAVLY